MPEIFGWQHLVYLAVAIVIGVVALVLIKLYCKSDKALSIAIKVYSAFLLVWIVANRILIAVRDQKVLNFIPGTFCGITSLSFAIIGLTAKKDDGILHWITYCAFLGGLLTMIYPDFIGQDKSIFFPLTITGLVHHTVMFFLSLTMLVTGYVKPSLKRWAWLPLGLCVMMVVGQLMISVGLYGDAMYINEPLIEGTLFSWWFTGIIFLWLHFAFLCIMEWVYYRHGHGTFYEWRHKNRA